MMVPVFAYGPGAEIFSGVYDNTAIFSKLMKLLNFHRPMYFTHTFRITLILLLSILDFICRMLARKKKIKKTRLKRAI